MNFTWSHYDGPRETVLVLDSASTPVAVQAGTQATMEATQLHLGMRGLDGAVGGTISPINFAYGDASPRVIIPALVGKIILSVNINVATPFNGVGAVLSIGTLSNPSLLVSSTQLDLSMATEFEISPNYVFGISTDIYLTLSPGAGGTQGVGWLVFAFAVLS